MDKKVKIIYIMDNILENINLLGFSNFLGENFLNHLRSNRLLIYHYLTYVSRKIGLPITDFKTPLKIPLRCSKIKYL